MTSAANVNDKMRKGNRNTGVSTVACTAAMQKKHSAYSKQLILDK